MHKDGKDPKQTDDTTTSTSSQEKEQSTHKHGHGHKHGQNTEEKPSLKEKVKAVLHKD